MWLQELGKVNISDHCFDICADSASDPHEVVVLMFKVLYFIEPADLQKEEAPIFPPTTCKSV